MPDSTQDSHLKYPWQQFVLVAVAELNSDRLRLKINAAERAISQRLRELSSADWEEQIALKDALQTLKVLFPDQCTADRNQSDKETDIA